MGKKYNNNTFKLGDYLNAINYSKEQLMREDSSGQAIKNYSPFIINKTLSYFVDTVMYANEMNLNAFLDKELQFDFFINIIRKRKRFSRWHKKIRIEDLDFIKEYFQYSDVKAKEILDLLSDQDIDKIKMALRKGGKKK